MRRLIAVVAGLVLVLSAVSPVFGRAPGVERPEGWTNEGALFRVCVLSVSAKTGLSPTDPGVIGYCLAWLNGDIVSPPAH
jgi:hypothetical protein